MKVLFVAGFGPVVKDMAASNHFYAGDLGLPLEGDETYRTTDKVEGVKHFALWPLPAAAESCFGTATWPDDVPAPQGWIEFDVDDIAAATKELQSKGYRLLVSDRMEPWGQRVTRLLGPDGLLVGITHTPFLREE